MGSTQSSPRGPSEVRRHKLECAKQKLQEAMITIRQAGDGWLIDHRILTIQESIAQLKRKTGWPIEGQVIQITTASLSWNRSIAEVLSLFSLKCCVLILMMKDWVFFPMLMNVVLSYPRRFLYRNTLGHFRTNKV